MNILRQSTAVDVLIGPFVDLTDGATAEEGETPTVLLSKNGQALGAKNDADVPVHDDAGYYNCELDATDTATVGTLVLIVEATGSALPVRHEYQVIEEAAYDHLYAGAADPKAITSVSGAVGSVTGAVGSVTGHTNQTGDSFARLAAPAGASVSADIAALKAETATIVADTNELQTDDVPTLIAAVQADTDDIQTRLPAALSGGRMAADAQAISTSTDAADKLEASAETIEVSAAAAGTLSVTQMTTTLTEVTDDHYNGRIIIWTSGVLLRQATDITDYDGGTKMLTYTAVTEAPGDGDTFIIV